MSGIGYPSQTPLGGIQLQATQDYTSTSMPAQWFFNTTPKGRTTPATAIGISPNGNVVIGNLAPAITGIEITPRATLEINVPSVNMTTDATSNEGLLIPRLSKERISRMASPLTSTLVWANTPEYNSADKRVAKITETGFYYFDGTEWVSISKNTSTKEIKLDKIIDNKPTCSDTSVGSIHFGTIIISGKNTDAFGFCMKNSEGEAKWFYIYGGSGVTSSNSNLFGEL